MKIDAVKIIRSARRVRSVSAHMMGTTLVLKLPAYLTAEKEQYWVDHFKSKMVNRQNVQRSSKTDEALEARCRYLNRVYFKGELKWDSIRWVDNQRCRWGSCTPNAGTIRISSAMKDFPEWVVDYVLVHELAHLLVADHSAAFWALMYCYEQTERARGFLSGFSFAKNDPDDSDEMALIGLAGAFPR